MVIKKFDGSRLRFQITLIPFGQLTPNARFAQLFSNVHRNICDWAIWVGQLDLLVRLLLFSMDYFVILKALWANGKAIQILIIQLCGGELQKHTKSLKHANENCD